MRDSRILSGVLRGAVILALLIPMQLTAAEDATDVNEFIVKAPDSKALEAFVDSSGLEIGPLITYPNPSEEVLRYTRYTWIVSVPDSLQSVKDSLVEVLKAQPWVEYVEPNAIIQIEPEVEGESEGYLNMPDSFPWPYTPNDPLYPQQWNMRITKTNWAWNVTTGDTGVVIGIIDSGIDTDHEDLVGNFIEGWNFINNNTNVQDNEGHGTHVAGIPSAIIDNNEGIAGVSSTASTMPLKIDLTSIQQETNAILYAADNGVNIINISMGGDGDWQPEEDAVDYAWGKGLFICAACGNSNKDASIVYPASYEHVMSVGGSTSQDTRWNDGDYGSNYGATVTIYAPGKSLITTELGGGYKTNGRGTSLACPHIAGLAALIWSAHPEWTNQQVWDKIIESADTITIDKGKVLRMNARKALDVEKIEGIAEQPLVTPLTPVTHLSNWQISASIGRQITLRYSDLPQGFSASVFDATGRKVDELHSDQPSGTITWGECYGAGVYFISERSGNPTTHKVILVR